MTRVRHGANLTEGFYESKLLVASDRNQIQINLITAIKRGKKDKLLNLADLHILIAYHYKFTLVGDGERVKMCSADLNVLWKSLNSKGKKGATG